VNFEKEEIGRYVAKTSDKIIQLLEEKYEYSILEEFKNKYITVDTNNCTEKLSKYILELMKNGYREGNEKTLDTDIKEKLTL